jgi:hypothetical protein
VSEDTFMRGVEISVEGDISVEKKVFEIYHVEKGKVIDLSLQLWLFL